MKHILTAAGLLILPTVTMANPVDSSLSFTVGERSQQHYNSSTRAQVQGRYALNDFFYVAAEYDGYKQSYEVDNYYIGVGGQVMLSPDLSLTLQADKSIRKRVSEYKQSLDGWRAQLQIKQKINEVWALALTHNFDSFEYDDNDFSPGRENYNEMFVELEFISSPSISFSFKANSDNLLLGTEYRF